MSATFIDRRAASMPEEADNSTELQRRIFEQNGPLEADITDVAPGFIFVRPLARPTTTTSAIYLAGKTNPFVADVWEVVAGQATINSYVDAKPGDHVILVVPQLLPCREDHQLYFLKSQYVVAKVA